MAEPTLSEVHADLVGRLRQDERLREVEKQVASLSNLPTLIERMENRLTSAITENKPKSAWPAVAACTSVFVALMGLFAVVYAK